MATLLGTGGKSATRDTGTAGAAARGVLTPMTTVVDRIRGAIGVLYREMLKFGVVGAVAFIVDFGLFNLLASDVWPGTGTAPLDGHEKIAKVISATVATVVAWLGNRHWSFRHRRQAAAHRELLLFAVMNVGGMAIAVSCLTVSHDLLGFTSTLADNISGVLIGTALGTIFRFWAYRSFVFTEFRDPDTAGATLAPARSAPVSAPAPDTAIPGRTPVDTPDSPAA